MHAHAPSCVLYKYDIIGSQDTEPVLFHSVKDCQIIVQLYIRVMIGSSTLFLPLCIVNLCDLSCLE